MDSNSGTDDECRVCLNPATPLGRVELACKHVFCKPCIVKFIQTLRSYSMLRPEKLSCLEDGCTQEIDEKTMMKLFPG